MAKFPYIETDAAQGAPSLMPYMPIRLLHGSTSIDVSALVDSGAALNVLSYDVGLALGLNWDEQRVPVQLGGNISDSNACAVLIDAIVGTFPATRLAFAWSSRKDIPTILGQVNFFMAFDVSFFRSQSYFIISPSDNG